MSEIQTDILLIGSGVMSSTLGMLLHQLDPSRKIMMLERLDKVAAESSNGWNNAGTGHAAYCELNYTPRLENGQIAIDKALQINEAFETTLQFWSYLVEQGALPEAKRFIHPVPHVSFVWGEQNVAFLRQRYERLRAHHAFAGIEYSEDAAVLGKWMPLVMQGRDSGQAVAATRIPAGSDVNFGELSRSMVRHLERQPGFSLRLDHEVTALGQDANGAWQIICVDRTSGEQHKINAAFVFIGAGGGALSLLQKTGLDEARGYGGFPVSGQFLICDNPHIVKQHHAKVYGLAALGAPPMSVPHLDSRIIDGKKVLLFGPFAGFTTRFLKTGSLLDLPASVKPHNLASLLGVARSSLPLIRYLIREVFQSSADRVESLRAYYPEADASDWTLQTAGQRVQIIKKDSEHGGKLQFGTEMVVAADKSLAALLGASPGASTGVKTLVDLIEHCFGNELQSAAWQNKLQAMIPSWRHSLAEDEVLYRAVHKRVLDTLELDSANVLQND